MLSFHATGLTCLSQSTLLAVFTDDSRKAFDEAGKSTPARKKEWRAGKWRNAQEQARPCTITQGTSTIIHALIQSITQSVIPSLNHSFSHSISHSCIQPVTPSFNQQFNYSISHSIMQPDTILSARHSANHSFSHSISHSRIEPATNLLNHSFNHLAKHRRWSAFTRSLVNMMTLSHRRSSHVLPRRHNSKHQRTSLTRLWYPTRAT